MTMREPNRTLLRETVTEKFKDTDRKPKRLPMIGAKTYSYKMASDSFNAMYNLSWTTATMSTSQMATECRHPRGEKPTLRLRVVTRTTLTQRTTMTANLAKTKTRCCKLHQKNALISQRYFPISEGSKAHSAVQTKSEKLAHTPAKVLSFTFWHHLSYSYCDTIIFILLNKQRVSQ